MYSDLINSKTLIIMEFNKKIKEELTNFEKIKSYTTHLKMIKGWKEASKQNRSLSTIGSVSTKGICLGSGNNF